MAATDTFTTQTGSLPEWAKPYYESMMNNAQTAAAQQYDPYIKSLTAGLSQDQNTATNMARGIANQGTPAGMQTAQAGLGALAPQMANAGNFQMGQVGSQNWTDPGVASSYMNPFTNQVVGNTVGLMNTQFGQQQRDAASKQQQAGAFGGYRADLQNSEAQKNQNLAMGNTVGNLYNTGYNQGAQQFNADQTRGMQAQTTNTANQLGQGALQLQGQQASAQADLGLANTAVQQRTMDQNAQQGLERVGALQQQTTQNADTAAYNEWLRGQNWGLGQQTALSGILHGVPLPQSSTTTTTQPPPNIYSQLAGLGLGAVGLNNLIKG